MGLNLEIAQLEEVFSRRASYPPNLLIFNLLNKGNRYCRKYSTILHVECGKVELARVSIHCSFPLDITWGKEVKKDNFTTTIDPVSVIT
jgi:hypothetical protein